MSSRENILARIRAANAVAKSSGALGGAPELRISEHPRGPHPDLSWDALQKFIDQSRASASSVEQIDRIDDLPTAVSNYLTENALEKHLVGWDDYQSLDWVSAGLEMEARPAQGSDKVGVTGSFCAIAETGTLVTLSGEMSPATTSLLPETHIAVLRTSRIVKTMEDAWSLVRQEVGDLPRQVNFISGPSRTADIEMTLVYGAHGPFRVHVILLNDE
jgi:L-lactate dehydrogenase complex protein LldG